MPQIEVLEQSRQQLVERLAEHEGEFIMAAIWGPNSPKKHIRLGIIGLGAGGVLSARVKPNDTEDSSILLSTKGMRYAELGNPNKPTNNFPTLEVVRKRPVISYGWLIQNGDLVPDPDEIRTKYHGLNRALLIGDKKVWGWVLGQVKYGDQSPPIRDSHIPVVLDKDGKPIGFADKPKDPMLMAQFRMMQLLLGRVQLPEEGINIIKDLRREVLDELSSWVKNYFNSEDPYYRITAREQITFLAEKAIATGMDRTDEFSKERVIVLGRRFRSDQFVNRVILLVGLQG